MVAPDALLKARAKANGIKLTAKKASGGRRNKSAKELRAQLKKRPHAVAGVARRRKVPRTRTGYQKLCWAWKRRNHVGRGVNCYRMAHGIPAKHYPKALTFTKDLRAYYNHVYGRDSFRKHRRSYAGVAVHAKRNISHRKRANGRFV